MSKMLEIIPWIDAETDRLRALEFKPLEHSHVNPRYRVLDSDSQLLLSSEVGWLWSASDCGCYLYAIDVDSDLVVDRFLSDCMEEAVLSRMHDVHTYIMNSFGVDQSMIVDRARRAGASLTRFLSCEGR